MAKTSKRRTRRKSPVRIKITHKGTLMGYKVHNGATTRRKSLSSAVRRFGYSTVMKKLNALYVFNKNKHKDVAKIVTSDKVWLKNHYGSGKMGMCGCNKSASMGMCGKNHTASMGMRAKRKSSKRSSKRKSSKRSSKRKSSKRSSKRKSSKRSSKRKSSKRKSSKRSSKRKSSKRKSSKRSSKRKSSKRSSKVAGCSKQTTKKYTTRPGPPYPANKCHGQRRKGNDGHFYTSVVNKKGIYVWRK